MAKMQAGNKPGMQQLADSLILSGEGTHGGAVSSRFRREVLDVLEGLAKSRQPAGTAVSGLSTQCLRAVPPCRAKGVISAAWATTSSSTAR